MKGSKKWNLFLLSVSLILISLETVQANTTTVETTMSSRETTQTSSVIKEESLLTETKNTENTDENILPKKVEKKGLQTDQRQMVNIPKKTENTRPYFTDDRYIKITNRYYTIWSNFNWVKRSSSASLFGQTLKVRGRYEFKNGPTYYSLFNNQGKWLGYLNANATQTITSQGPYLSDGRLIKINKKGWTLYNGFNWNYRNSSTNLYGKTFRARGRYQHFNGSTYYTLYDHKGNWQGYINAAATTKTDDNGTYFSDNRYLNISKKGYGIWNNFKWHRRGTSTNLYGQTFHVRGRYEFFSGATYYSLYDDEGNWQGYINSAATSKTNVTETKTTTFNQELLRLVNVERKKHRLSQLKYDPHFLKAAEIRANEIIEVFDHIRPNGKEYDTIFDEVTPGIIYKTSSENIAYSTSKKSQKEDAQHLFKIWMESPGHKENILTPDHRYCGFASKKAGSITYAVQLFTAGTF